jgi:hypothetical protein
MYFVPKFREIKQIDPELFKEGKIGIKELFLQKIKK